MMTYEELIEKCKNGDPVIDVDRPDSWRVTEEGLIIDGIDEETEFCLDVRIEILNNGAFCVWVREPKDFLGRGWTHGIVLDSYEKVCSWLYSW